MPEYTYNVVCNGLDRTPGTFPDLASARSYALGIANREDVQCAITDKFKNIEIVVRSGPVDPLRREYDPYRGQPFFHPNPEHPRSRERFLRNEPQGWTPGMGPAQTQIRPREFFGMNDDHSILAALVPPALLLGVVLFLTRPGAGLGDELAPMEHPRDGSAPGKPTLLPSIRRRHAARKLYGSSVLAAQAAASMRTLAVEARDRAIANEAARLQTVSRALLDRASGYDSEFVRSKLT